MKKLLLLFVTVSIIGSTVYFYRHRSIPIAGDTNMSLAEANLLKGTKFLAENAKNPAVTVLPSGLQYEVLTAGQGAKPNAADTVTVHYSGTLIDGTEFDSSYKRGRPLSFPLNAVIAGWTEGLQLMSVGSKWKLYIPANLAYGSYGAGGVIGPNEALIFTVELLAIEH